MDSVSNTIYVLAVRGATSDGLQAQRLLHPRKDVESSISLIETTYRKNFIDCFNFGLTQII